MDQYLLDEFIQSKDTLRVFKDDNIIFKSDRDRILPLLDYIDCYSSKFTDVTIFDKVVGNASALLSVKAHCNKIYGPLGSQLATKTLSKYGITYNITSIIPSILKKDGTGICPMETLSKDKEPDDFYEEVKQFIGEPLSSQENPVSN